LARQEIEIQKRIHEEQNRQYEEQKRLYEQRLAEYEEAKRKERALKQLELGLRMLGGQGVRDAALATAGMAPVPPRAPKSRDSNQSFNVLMPNGAMIRCRDTGTAFFCNN
jgi:phosphoglucomutase